jgi:septal ring factor EnvC (AmiA/AmiB activator)
MRKVVLHARLRALKDGNVDMEDSVQTARELATHANEIKHIQSDMDQVLQELEAMKATIDSINQKLDRAEGGWKTLIWIGGLATSVTGIIGYIIGQVRG